MRTIKRDIVGAFIFSADNKVLFGKGGVYEGAWICPGGGLEAGETLLDAVKREVLEETGLDIANSDITQVEGALTGKSEKTLRDTHERVRVEMMFYNFVVKLPQKADKVTVNAADDFSDATWFPVADLKKLKLSPPSVITLQKLKYL